MAEAELLPFRPLLRNGTNRLRVGRRVYSSVVGVFSADRQLAALFWVYSNIVRLRLALFWIGVMAGPWLVFVDWLRYSSFFEAWFIRLGVCFQPRWTPESLHRLFTSLVSRHTLTVRFQIPSFASAVPFLSIPPAHLHFCTSFSPPHDLG